MLDYIFMYSLDILDHVDPRPGISKNGRISHDIPADADPLK
jgi:hypothetical protein